MSRSKMTTLVAGALVALFMGAAVAEAANIRVRCEKRTDGRTRSKISVDGRNVLPGTYTATVTSGRGENMNTATDTKASIGDSVGFDFDSAAREVGDVSIARNFIRNREVCAEITGNGLSLSGCASCKVK